MLGSYKINLRYLTYYDPIHNPRIFSLQLTRKTIQKLTELETNFILIHQ